MKIRHWLLLTLIFLLACKSNNKTDFILPTANHQLCQTFRELRNIEIQLELNEYWFVLANNEIDQRKNNGLLEKSYYKVEIENLSKNFKLLLDRNNCTEDKCHLHGQFMIKQDIKVFDTVFFYHEQNKYTKALNCEFPNADEPVNRYRNECGVGKPPYPNKVKKYICSDCNIARNIWLKENKSELK